MLDKTITKADENKTKTKADDNWGRNWGRTECFSWFQASLGNSLRESIACAEFSDDNPIPEVFEVFPSTAR